MSAPTVTTGDPPTPDQDDLSRLSYRELISELARVEGQVRVGLHEHDDDGTDPARDAQLMRLLLSERALVHHLTAARHQLPGGGPALS